MSGTHNLIVATMSTCQLCYSHLLNKMKNIEKDPKLADISQSKQYAN